MNAKQEEALREWLQEAIVPLIEQVLVKKLGQAMSYAATELVQPKREWQGLTDVDVSKILDEQNGFYTFEKCFNFAKAIEAKLKEKNHDPR